MEPMRLSNNSHTWRPEGTQAYVLGVNVSLPRSSWLGQQRGRFTAVRFSLSWRLFHQPMVGAKVTLATRLRNSGGLYTVDYSFLCSRGVYCRYGRFVVMVVVVDMPQLVFRTASGRFDSADTA